MLVPLLDVLGWGRGGLQGAGSGVVGVGDGIVPWATSVGFLDLVGVGRFDSWGWVLGSWGGGSRFLVCGDDRPAYLIGRLDGGLYSDDLAAVCFDGRGGGDYLDS